jgi:hypothetical protein
MFDDGNFWCFWCRLVDFSQHFTSPHLLTRRQHLDTAQRPLFTQLLTRPLFKPHQPLRVLQQPRYGPLPPALFNISLSGFITCLRFFQFQSQRVISASNLSPSIIATDATRSEISRFINPTRFSRTRSHTLQHTLSTRTVVAADAPTPPTINTLVTPRAF